MSRYDRDKIRQLSPKQRSKQREGLLTEAQTRDRRFRRIILNGLDLAGLDTHWYAVTLSDRKVLLTASRLTRKGIVTIVPERAKPVRVNGYAQGNKKRERRYRTLPGYLFVGINDGTAGLTRLILDPDVRAIIGRNGRAFRFTAESLDHFLAHVDSELPGAALADREVKAPIEKEDRVRVVGGPLSGQELTVIDIQGRFAEATHYLFGHECRTLVDLDALERVFS